MKVPITFTFKTKGKQFKKTFGIKAKTTTQALARAKTWIGLHSIISAELSKLAKHEHKV